jgi:hypothetical protein
MPYAERTRVPVGQSREEIRAMLVKHDAGKIMFGESADQVVIGFEMAGRVLRFTVKMPPAKQTLQTRRVWRALLLAIKAKLKAVESGIETFDEAFLAHVVVPGTMWTVGDDVIPRIEQLGESRGLPELPGW